MADDVVTPVVCRKYGILFPHDFSVAGKMVYDEVVEKYRKRIKRLHKLCSSCLPILFVAHNGQLNDWQQTQFDLCRDVSWKNSFAGWQERLSAILIVKYPTLQFGICDSRTLLELASGMQDID